MPEVGDETTGVTLDISQKAQPVDINENSLPEAQKSASPANGLPGSGDNGTTIVATETTVTGTPEAADVRSNGAEAGVGKEETSAGKWDELGLKPEVIKLLSTIKLKALTAGQKEEIRALTLHSDPVIVMESGTDVAPTLVAKAALMQHLDPESLEHQMLLLAPSRSAVLHVTYLLRNLTDGHKVRVRGVVGGSPLGADVESLRTGPQIVTGTTGRVIDLLERCFLNTSYIKFLVLENADSMLKNWYYDVWHILKKLPADVRVVLLSSTAKPDLVHKVSLLKAAPAEEMEKLKPEHLSKPRYEWHPKPHHARRRSQTKTPNGVNKEQESEPAAETTDTSSEPKTPVSASAPDVLTAEPAAVTATAEPASDQPAVLLASA